jgi:hypothetical protein
MPKSLLGKLGLNKKRPWSWRTSTIDPALVAEGENACQPEVQPGGTFESPAETERNLQPEGSQRTFSSQLNEHDTPGLPPLPNAERAMQAMSSEQPPASKLDDLRSRDVPPFPRPDEGNISSVTERDCTPQCAPENSVQPPALEEDNTVVVAAKPSVLDQGPFIFRLLDLYHERGSGGLGELMAWQNSTI